MYFNNALHVLLYTLSHLLIKNKLITKSNNYILVITIHRAADSDITIKLKPYSEACCS